jgi:CRISPR-associated exonuclease Cas4
VTEQDVETDGYLPLSGLRHLAYCERQCALIHVDGVWIENRLTLEGNRLHRNVDKEGREIRNGSRLVRSLPLRSDRLKLVGKADMVEMRSDGPYPVEYKHGTAGRWRNNEIQLCAQAMCLEEMTGRPIRNGAVYFGSSKCRIEVVFNDALRIQTELTARRYHEIVDACELPHAAFSSKCPKCSLREACMPEAEGSISAYIVKALNGAS